jgi:hypothetical protein
LWPKDILGRIGSDAIHLRASHSVVGQPRRRWSARSIGGFRNRWRTKVRGYNWTIFALIKDRGRLHVIFGCRPVFCGKSVIVTPKNQNRERDHDLNNPVGSFLPIEGFVELEFFKQVRVEDDSASGPFTVLK